MKSEVFNASFGTIVWYKYILLHKEMSNGVGPHILPTLVNGPPPTYDYNSNMHIHGNGKNIDHLNYFTWVYTDAIKCMTMMVGIT